MSNNLPFDFQVNWEKNQILVTKSFLAPLAMVWDAWTQAEHLDQWWAPKPYRAETKLMDFRPGGQWMYAMVSPENERHWTIADFKTIDNLANFSYSDAFTDENGIVIPTLPASHWTVDFAAADSDKTTQINILLQFASLEDLEKIIELGFQEGFTLGLGNLDEWLARLLKSQTLASQTLYHGTKANLRIGDLVEVGYRSNYGQRNKAKYVYLSATLDAATWGAELASGDGSGRIYIVEPIGLIEDDPNLTDKKFPGNPTRSYRTKSPLRIVGEVTDWQPHPPAQLKAMKDHLERLKEMGVEAIEE